MSGQPNAPLLPPAQAARLLDDVIFTRVAELIDLPRLYDLEAMLALQIDNLGVNSDHSRAIAKEMVDRALLRVARTSRKWTRCPPPDPDGAYDSAYNGAYNDASDDACDICGSPCDPQEPRADREPPTGR